MSTAPSSDRVAGRFRVTHPFHPWFGREFELVAHSRTWGEDRVFFYDERARLTALPASWTDWVHPDPFVVMAAGRSPFLVDDLCELAQQIRSWRKQRERRDV